MNELQIKLTDDEWRLLYDWILKGIPLCKKLMYDSDREEECKKNGGDSQCMDELPISDLSTFYRVLSEKANTIHSDLSPMCLHHMDGSVAYTAVYKYDTARSILNRVQQSERNLKDIAIAEDRMDFLRFFGGTLSEFSFTSVELDDIICVNMVINKSIFSGVVNYPSMMATKFSGTTIENTKITCGTFTNCYFSGCTFRNVELYYCSFYEGGFDNCTFSNVKFDGGCRMEFLDFYDNSIDGDTVLPDVPLNIDADKDNIGWKCVLNPDTNYYYVCKLLIPADAKKTRGTGYNYRCSKAKVLEFLDADGNKLPDDTTMTSAYYYRSPITYKVGEWIYPDMWDDDRWNDCTHGIHFYMEKNIVMDRVRGCNEIVPDIENLYNV